MREIKMQNYLASVLKNMPYEWLMLTTHRLDIYNEELAKSQFLEEVKRSYDEGNATPDALGSLPTAFDYIRLGHPLSCILEWAISDFNGLACDNVIAFSSNTVPVMAILRENILQNRKTKIYYSSELPFQQEANIWQSVYGYDFDFQKVDSPNEISPFDGTTIYFKEEEELFTLDLNNNIDFAVSTHSKLGSILAVNGEHNEAYISKIQHVRRRETIAMTPSNCLDALKLFVGNEEGISFEFHTKKESNKSQVVQAVNKITGTDTKVLVGSSGLSVQYAIMMGLIHDAKKNHPGKEIKVIVPPNCYGGTNDQARRVATSIDQVEVLDLPVDGGNDMVEGIDAVLNRTAESNAVSYIIAEIPTNPRVEVPNLQKLREVLSKERSTKEGLKAVEPVFILDQTFCPNVHFLGANDILSSVKTISYSSGSKFPSGGLCTAGYCVGNQKANALMNAIETHLILCDNEATPQQFAILANQMPSMIQRIQDAYSNAREFVHYIEETLPEAKINFVSEELAEQGFTPSVFSLDLPAKGNNDAEKEAYKRKLNLKLINKMIGEIPEESKFCVSYGQLKGCYWTVPATSTQGTTKEGDKDYIVRVALSANLDLDLHKQVFLNFAENL